jgi:flagellar assembly factor FliW
MQMQVESTRKNDIAALGLVNMTAVEEQENVPHESEHLTIASRFGEVTVHLANAIHFPQGLLGLPDDLHFCLTDIPKENMGQFKLLQCLNDHSLSFVVLPLDLDNNLIEKEDLQDACRQANIAENTLALLMITSVQRSPEGVSVTANVRAPILVDVDDKAAIQFVFSNSKYNICHPITS